MQVVLVSKDGPLNARSREGISGGWNWNNNFKIREKTSNEEAHNDDMQVFNEEKPPSGKLIFEKEKAKQLTWPSTLAA